MFTNSYIYVNIHITPRSGLKKRIHVYMYIQIHIYMYIYILHLDLA